MTTDFNTKIVVEQSPKDVFNAINNVRGWWSEEIDGNTDKLHEEFRYRYKDVHTSRIKIMELVPDEKVVWHVLDNTFSFTRDKHEWVGTNIVFEIKRKNDKTQLQFTHVGLVPTEECYEACREGWTNYINESLRNLITTGKGQPNPKEGGFNEALVEKLNLKK